LENRTEVKDYLVEYKKFKGPLYLLLDLVREKKEDIYEISLNAIIKDFISYIKDNKNVLFDTLSGFIYVASILLEIKSRSLLPSKNEAASEEENILNSEILKKREEEYRIFKKISNYLRSIYEKESLFFIREAPIEKEFLSLLPDFTRDINIEELSLIASKLIKYSEERLDLESIYNQRSGINIFGEMKRIKKLLSLKDNITFKEITSKYERIIDKIVSFLSLLELYKKNEIDIIQFENFGSIIIKRIK